MRNKHKPNLWPSTLYPEDMRALALFFSKYKHAMIRVDGQKIVLRAIGVKHFHEIAIRLTGVEEVEA